MAFAPIRTLDPALLLSSLEIYEMHRIDYADVYLVGSAERAGVLPLLSLFQNVQV